MPLQLFGQTIEEKKEAMREKEEREVPELHDLLLNVNRQLKEMRKALAITYQEAAAAHANGGSTEEIAEKLEEITHLREEIWEIEEEWREESLLEAKRDEEGYALWDLEESTLAQMVMEFGAPDHLYMIPPEMAALKIHMHSSIPIPRESWSYVLEIILAQNGVGIKEISPSVRQLFLLKQNLGIVHSIVTNNQGMALVPPGARLFYLLSPPAEQSRAIFQFFERFAEAKQTFIYAIGSKVAIVSSREEVERLLALYNAVWEAEGRVSKVVAVTKMGAKEMEKIISSFFGEGIDKNRQFFGKSIQDRLHIFALDQGNALVLIGQKDVVERAEKVISETEKQLQDPSEMAVFLYTCRHSDPKELAGILERVYLSLLATNSDSASVNMSSPDYSVSSAAPALPDPKVGVADSSVAVNGSAISSANKSRSESERGSDHFIADPKTGGLLMVIRRDAYTKIKDLLRKLDVPKKMVQIEVLLFEKQLAKQTSFGMNLLRLGNLGEKSVEYKGCFTPSGLGVLEFVFKGNKKGHRPAFNLAYNFLMTQDDVQLNAAPSVLTVNQTPATVSIVEEISINNGASAVNTNKSGVVFEKSFSRAQYGIIIVLTPTIHLALDGSDRDENDGFITLQTNITFDTTKNSNDDRPLVDKRHIENEVRVHDGQTIILGGLRRKSTQEKRDKVPFLGDLPGIGKLFGSTTLINNNTEMFFFITPKIILDPKDELERIRTEELKKRPGDTPEFLLHLEEAREKEKSGQIMKSLKQLIGSHG